MSKNIEGSVVSVSSTGSLVCDITKDQLTDSPRDESLVIKFGDHETFGLYEANHDQPDMTMVAKLNDSGQLEIEIVGLNLSEMLGVSAGHPVSVRW